MTEANATEQQILNTFLLSRASLQDIVTLRQFTELFPKNQRANPQIKLLYQEIQVLRNRQCERVNRVIKMEVRNAAKQRKEFRAKKRDERAIHLDEMEGIELYGAPPAQKKLTLPELIEQMEYAAADMEQEHNRLDEECTQMYKQMDTIVGDMSDLRYGKLTTSSKPELVAQQLFGLTEACDKALSAANRNED